MKRIVPTFALLFLLCSANGQDILSGPSIWNLDSYETENAEVIKAERNTRFHVLYSPYLSFRPNAYAGFQIAIQDLWGGYISAAYNFSEKESLFITAGALKQISTLVNIHAGVSMFPSYRPYSDIAVHGVDKILPFGIEAGVLINIKSLSFEAAIGSPIIEYAIGYYSGWDFDFGEGPYLKIGIGFNF